MAQALVAVGLLLMASGNRPAPAAPRGKCDADLITAMGGPVAVAAIFGIAPQAVSALLALSFLSNGLSEFMGALLRRLVSGGTTSVLQAGRPPFAPCLPSAPVLAYPAGAVTSLWPCGRLPRCSGAGASSSCPGAVHG